MHRVDEKSIHIQYSYQSHCHSILHLPLTGCRPSSATRSSLSFAINVQVFALDAYAGIIQAVTTLLTIIAIIGYSILRRADCLLAQRISEDRVTGSFVIV